MKTKKEMSIQDFVASQGVDLNKGGRTKSARAHVYQTTGVDPMNGSEERTKNELRTSVYVRPYTQTGCKVILGIDPGVSGAIAVISLENPHNVNVVPVKTVRVGKKKELDEEWLAVFFKGVAEYVEHAFIEKVGAMPGQGVTSMFNFGASYGIVRGMCAAHKIPYTLIPPQRWKRHMCGNIKQGKQSSVVVAKAIWEDVNLLATKRSRKPHDGMADALLIAEYGRTHL